MITQLFTLIRLSFFFFILLVLSVSLLFPLDLPNSLDLFRFVSYLLIFELFYQNST